MKPTFDPVKFLWGTFCRKVIVDRESQSPSLIDVITEIDVTPSKIRLSPESSEFVLLSSLGPLNSIFLFSRNIELPTEIELILDVDLVLPGAKIISEKVPLLIEQDLNHGFIILDFENLFFPVSSVSERTKYLVEVICRYEDHEIARIKLSIDVELDSEDVELDSE